VSVVKIGEKIPLALKLHDNRPGMTVRADIFSMYGDRLSSVYLYHAQSGLYINTDLPMPDVPYALVTYTVEDSEDYESVCERIDSRQRDSEPEKYISGQVTSESTSSEFITGVIDETTNN
jgi:hypothetical protein